MESEKSIVNASFHQTHWSIAPFGTGASRVKNVGFVFGGEVLRFFHGGDECLTVPANWSDSAELNTVVYEGGAVFSQARSLWRLDLVRTKWLVVLGFAHKVAIPLMKVFIYLNFN